MKLEAFFDKFDQLVEAPNAVDKLREMVLQLAVQGKLVEQSHADGEARELLAAIADERSTHGSRPEVHEEELGRDGDNDLFQIPSNWAWTRLGNIALLIQYGYTASADPSLTEIRMLRITDIQNNRVDWSSVPGCQVDREQAERYLLSLNDILIARTGGTIGKSFLVREVPVVSIFASYLIRVTPPHAMAARYLKIFLESPFYWTQLRTMSAGTGQPNVNGQALGRLVLPLPPLKEQQRIVAKVDDLMLVCDRLDAQQKERDARREALARASLARFADEPTPPNLSFLFHDSYSIAPDDLREAIFNLAVQGKLLRQNPNDEPAEALNEKLPPLLRAIAHRLGARFEMPRTAIERQVGPPVGWGVAELRCLGITQTGTTPSKSEPEFEGNHIPFIRPGDIRGDDIDYDKIGLSIDGLNAGRLIPRNSVLMVSIGGSIGKTALVDRDVSCNQQINSVTPAECIESRFVLTAMRSQLFQREVMNRAAQGTLPIISKSKWETIQIPIPPLAEQRRIVAKLDQLMVLVDQLGTQLTAFRTTAARLMEAVVSELLNAQD